MASTASREMTSVGFNPEPSLDLDTTRKMFAKPSQGKERSNLHKDSKQQRSWILSTIPEVSSKFNVIEAVGSRGPFPPDINSRSGHDVFEIPCDFGAFVAI